MVNYDVVQRAPLVHGTRQVPRIQPFIEPKIKISQQVEAATGGDLMKYFCCNSTTTA
jgi:hypothetical protein